MKDLLLLICTLTLLITKAHANDTLQLLWEGKRAEISYDQWSTKYAKEKVQQIIEDHPNYKNNISYEGVNFARLMFSFGRKITKDDVVIITCTDGYRPILNGEFFEDGKAILAYKEVHPSDRVTKDGRWTKVKMEDEYVSPGPYYLVWPSQSGHKHSWPYQIQRIEIKKKKEFNEFTKIEPIDKKAQVGFNLFKAKCLKCHSIKYVGPKGKAPDLAYVTGYRSNQFIKNRIRKGRGKMPPFSKAMIKDSEIEEVLKYLQSVYEEK